MTKKETIEFALARSASEDGGRQILLLSKATSEDKVLLDEAIAKFRDAGYRLKVIAKKHRQDGDVKRALQAWEAHRNALRGTAIQFSD
jgi:hypothetical protein